jgi:VanZ family protein
MEDGRPTRLFLLYFLPVLLWMAVIFGLSAMPGGTGGYPMPFWMLLERKGANIFEYFVLALLALRLFMATFPEGKARLVGPAMKRAESMLGAGLAALAYAGSDELHQMFVSGREGKPTDVMIDFVGIVLALLAAAWWFRRAENGKRSARRFAPSKDSPEV